MGHTKVRCKKATVAPDDFDTVNAGDGGYTTGGMGNNEAAKPVDDSWMKEATAKAATAGGDGWGAGGDW